MNSQEFEDMFDDAPVRFHKKPIRGDRWVAMVLAIGAAFWLGMWLVLR